MLFVKYEHETQDINEYAEDIVYVRDENGMMVEMPDAPEVSEDVADN